MTISTILGTMAENSNCLILIVGNTAIFRSNMSMSKKYQNIKSMFFSEIRIGCGLKNADAIAITEGEVLFATKKGLWGRGGGGGVGGGGGGGRGLNGQKMMTFS